MPEETIQVIESNAVTVTVTETNEATITVTEGETVTITLSDSIKEVFRYNTYTATAGQTEFTLSYTPRTNSARVFVDGIYYAPSEYSISGTTLTFGAGLTEGSIVDVDYVQN